MKIVRAVSPMPDIKTEPMSPSKPVYFVQPKPEDYDSDTDNDSDSESEYEVEIDRPSKRKSWGQIKHAISQVSRKSWTRHVRFQNGLTKEGRILPHRHPISENF